MCSIFLRIYLLVTDPILFCLVHPQCQILMDRTGRWCGLCHLECFAVCSAGVGVLVFLCVDLTVSFRCCEDKLRAIRASGELGIARSVRYLHLVRYTMDNLVDILDCIDGSSYQSEANRGDI